MVTVPGSVALCALDGATVHGVALTARFGGEVLVSRHDYEPQGLQLNLFIRFDMSFCCTIVKKKGKRTLLRLLLEELQMSDGPTGLAIASNKQGAHPIVSLSPLALDST